jgi:predicted nucleic acid-binding protein
MNQGERFVLDGSVALAWYFRDEQDAYADVVASRFPDAEAIVPMIWHLEIANAIIMGERRKRGTIAQAANWLSYLESLSITVDGETGKKAWADTLNLARAQKLSAYDASYLELALRLGLGIATLDKELKTAAKVVGVPIYKP